MSLVPQIVRELAQEMDANKLSMGLVELMPYMDTGYFRPWRYNLAEDSGVSTVVKDSSGLKISLDVKHFKPENLNVKVVDGFIVVEGKHDETLDEHGFISRQFTRRYHLPLDVDIDAVQSTLSSDNVLQVVVPQKAHKNKVVNIPISKINLAISPATSPKPPAEKRIKI